jgi:replication factor C large subunit
VGKTTAAHALAKDKGWNVVEMNASDKRTKSEVQDIAGSSAENHSLGTQSRTLIILDEADNLHGNTDRGGKSAITSIVKSAQQPIILLANDYYDLTRSLRNNTTEVEFSNLSKSDIAKGLQQICEKEGIEYESRALHKIAQASQGDFRGAVMALQASVMDGQVTREVLNLDSRDKKQEIFPFLDSLFKKDSAKEVLEKSYQLDETPEDLYRWVDQNVYKVYEGEELVVALDFLSNADRWRGRTRKTQNYSYWRYLSDNLTAGIASARNGTKGGWTRWQPPRYSSQSGPDQETLAKIGAIIGASTQSVRLHMLPYIEKMVHHCKPEELTVLFTAAFDWDTSEISAITGSGKTTNKVERIYEKAQELQDEQISFEQKSNLNDIHTNRETISEPQDTSDDEEDTTEDNTETEEDEDDDPDSQTDFSQFL